MNIPVHHNDNRQAYTYLGSSHYHDKKNKYLRIASGAWISHTKLQVLHFRKGNEQ
jgi:hypothetical protein